MMTLSSFARTALMCPPHELAFREVFDEPGERPLMIDEDCGRRELSTLEQGERARRAR